MYIDDIAIVTKNASDLQRVLKRVQELSIILGFQTNPRRTKVYRWATRPQSRQRRQAPHHDVLWWTGKDILMRPPIFGIWGIQLHTHWGLKKQGMK